jgi:transmembrane sensor
MNERIVSLLYRYVKGERLEDSENEELSSWVAASPHNKKVFDEVNDEAYLHQEVRRMLDYDGSALWNKIHSKLPSQRRNPISILRRNPILKYAAVAILFTGLAFGGYRLMSNSNKTSPTINQTAALNPRDITAPDGRTVLILQGGQRINLENLKDGNVVNEPGMQVVKSGDAIKYLSNLNETVTYNTIETGVHGFYTLTMDDGTTVTLDAKSTLTYPSSFKGNSKERRVELSGHAYFDVAKDKTKPFYVTTVFSGNKKVRSEISVIGTRFDVDSYDDDAVSRTTLVEGKVKISAVNAITRVRDSKLLAPGDQAILQEGKAINVTNDMDTDVIISWINGMINFENADIEAIMRHIKRHYGVSVRYEGKRISSKFFVGPISKDVSVRQLLAYMEATGEVSFKVSQNEIVVVSR